MATPTIPNGEEQFFNILYEGNGAGQRVGKFVPFTDNGTIANSCIFNDDDLPRLYRQISAGNRKTYTISLWFKLGKSPPTDGAGFWSTSPSNDSGYGGNPSPYNLAFLQFVSGAIEIQDYEVSGNHYIMRKRTNRTFEDTSKWYHFLMAVDTTQSTESDRMKMYIDGDLITSFNDLNSSFGYPDQNEDTGANKDTNYDVINIGYNQHWDGCIAEFNFVDGTALTPDTFGLTDTSTGRWIPKALTGITYGTNGYRLQFGSSSNFGDDTSGNNNDFSVINLVAGDQTTDSPTQNHATFDSQRNGGDWTLSEGNLKIVGTPSTGAGRMCLSGMNVPNSGKIYWEVEADAINDSPRYVGLFKDKVSLTAGASTIDMRWLAIRNGGSADGKLWDGKVVSSQLTTFTSGDIIQFARDGEKLWIGKNNTWLNSGNPSTGANPLLTNIDTKNSNWKMGVWSLSTGLGGASHTFIMNAGQKTFSYTPPTGFSAWQQDNLPETAKGVSGLVWMKNRDASDNNQLYDSSRGKQKDLHSNTIDDESTTTDGLQKFLKGGQQIEDDVSINTSGESYISWNWVANGGVTSTNNNGSISSVVQANQTAGFSIVQWTGLGGGTGRTIGHGLSSAPEWIIVKPLTGSSSYNWNIYHIGTDASNPSDYFISLNTTNARDNSASTWNDTAPTSTVFSVNHEATAGASGNKMIAYCWHGVEGFSKFGKYTGNGSSDGPFIYTGFRPAWVMIKCFSTSGNGWTIHDNKRMPFNGSSTETTLYASSSQAEQTSGGNLIDFLSNGFKLRGTNTNLNGSRTYIYMAFAEHPFVGDGTNPVTAR